MMKAIKLFFTAAVALLIMASCDQQVTTKDHNVLPANAQEMITSHFPNTTITNIKVDDPKEASKEYEVTLSDGSKIEFSASGMVKEVDCVKSGIVPVSILPHAVRAYLESNYPDHGVVKFEIGSDIDVRLNNGVELEFTREGEFIKIDR